MITMTGVSTTGNLVNGLNYIFSPSTTQIRGAFTINTQARSMFVVSRRIPPTSGATLRYLGGSAGWQNTLAQYVTATTTRLIFGVNGFNKLVTIVPSAPLQVVNLLSFVNSATVALNILCVNGTSQALTTNVEASGYATTSTLHGINNPNNTSSIDMMEMLFYYGDLNTLDRQRVEGYLAWKWGIQTLLPGTHPYKTLTP